MKKLIIILSLLMMLGCAHVQTSQTPQNEDGIEEISRPMTEKEERIFWDIIDLILLYIPWWKL